MRQKKKKKKLEDSLNKAGTQTDICAACSQRIIHIRQKLGTPQVSRDRKMGKENMLCAPSEYNSLSLEKGGTESYCLMDIQSFSSAK